MDPITLAIGAIGIGMQLFGASEGASASGQERAAVQQANYDYGQEYQAEAQASGFAQQDVQLQQQQATLDYQRSIRMNNAQSAMMTGAATSNVTLAGAGMSSAAVGGRQQIEGQRLSANAQAGQNNQVTQGQFAARYGQLGAENQAAYWQSQANAAMGRYTSASTKVQQGNQFAQFGGQLINQAPNASNLANYAGQQFFGGGAGDSTNPSDFTNPLNWIPTIT